MSGVRHVILGAAVLLLLAGVGGALASAEQDYLDAEEKNCNVSWVPQTPLTWICYSTSGSESCRVILSSILPYMPPCDSTCLAHVTCSRARTHRRCRQRREH